VREDARALIDVLVGAVVNRWVARIVYDRQRDGVTSIHEVAPIDVSPGPTAGSAAKVYLIAWCFAESKPETHLVERIRDVSLTGETFEPKAIASSWPVKEWPIPAEWVVPRKWEL